MTHPSIEMLDPREIKDLLNRGKRLPVDIREPAEFAVERIHGAALYPLSAFDASTLRPDGMGRAVFHCASGKRSLAADEKRLAAGNDQAAHMDGGITAWSAPACRSSRCARRQAARSTDVSSPSGSGLKHPYRTALSPSPLPPRPGSCGSRRR